MANFYGSLCLTDIPKELITTARNGKKYLNIEVNERREVSQYGATHSVRCSVRKDEIREGVNYYIGELKPSKFGNDKPNTAALTPSNAQSVQTFTQADDDGVLPF